MRQTRTTVAGAIVFAGLLACLTASPVEATVAVSPLFGNNMVLQRDKPVPVYGTATNGSTVTVIFNGQTNSTVADARGNWQVTLNPMPVNATGGTLAISESGGNTITFTNVVVGDVWLASGQSNMAFMLGSCGRPQDIANANYPGFRHFRVAGEPTTSAQEPTRDFSGNWVVCMSNTAGSFSGTAFYFARRIYQQMGSNVPIGVINTSVGGSRVDQWLAQESLIDIPVIWPLYSQDILPGGPFSLFNGMVNPLTPYMVKGMIWYQGENGENSPAQSADSYFLKLKALSQGWKHLWDIHDDFPFYIVQIANYNTLPATPAPVLFSGGWNADTRLQQRNAMALPHAGMCSAIDLGETDSMHPTNKYDIGERLALWALKNDYGVDVPAVSGPMLKDVTVAGSRVVCSFDHVGGGLIVGSKQAYNPVEDVSSTGSLQRFSICGTNGVWYWADAIISNNMVVLSSPSVPVPRKVSYACWQNPLGCNLYCTYVFNGETNGMPALPFYVDDVTAKYAVVALAGPGGSITPSGTNSLLKRMTALYTITPDSNYYIQDVTVDGVSVGASKYYTLEPMYSNHTILATFTTNVPHYTITCVAGTNGSFSPGGTITVTQGASLLITIVPDLDYAVDTVTVDGKPIGWRPWFMFADIITNHTIAATFYYTVPVAVIDNGNGATDVRMTSATLNGSLSFTGAPSDVYIYWGLTDGGTNKAAWANEISVGSHGLGGFSASVTNLAIERTYYYRCCASNRIGVLFTDTASSFKSQPPVAVDNALGASGVTDSSATLNGTLLLTNGSPTDVYLFWGASDGGTNKAAWSNVIVLTNRTPGLFSSGITGLDIQKRYYYRCYGSNTFGGRWAASPSPFDTARDFSPWQNKMKIIVKGYNRSEALMNFPVLVALHEGITNFSYNQFSSSDGADLRFGNAYNSELNYEVDEWNPGGTSYVWVQMPVLTTDTYIWAYWGNAAATNFPACTTNGSVWSEGYAAVWHMSETNALDSLNLNHGMSQGATNTPCIIGTGQGMPGGADRSVLIGTVKPNLDITGSITISGWVNFNGTDMGGILTKGTGWGDFNLHNKGGGANYASMELKPFCNDSASSPVGTTSMLSGRWYYVCGTWNGNAARIFVNGRERRRRPPMASSTTPPTN